MIAVIILSLFVLTSCNNKKNLIRPPEIPDYSSYMTLGEYSNIEYTVKNDYTLTDKILNDELEDICISMANIKSLPDKKAEKGDYILLMYSGTIDGQTFQDSATNEQGTLICLGQTPGITSLFENKITGLKKGDSLKNLIIDIPENYSGSWIDGKKAEFTVYVSDIIEFSFENPITDEMVSECAEYYGESYETIDDVKQSILNDLKSLHDFEIYNAAMAQIVKNSTFSSYPENAVDDLVSAAVQVLEKNAASMGLTPEEFLKKYDNTDTVEEFKAQTAKDAEQYLQLRMIICEIARTENIKITSEEFTDYKTQRAEEMGYTDIRQLDINSAYSDTDLLIECLEPKVKDWLVEHTNVSNRYSFDR